MVEDDELLELFRVESEEYLQSLERGLLALEKSPTETASLEKLLRDAHSLKGAARIMDLPEIEKLSHHLEDCFRNAHQGTHQLASVDVGEMLASLDVLKELVSEALCDPPDVSKEASYGSGDTPLSLDSLLTPTGEVLDADSKINDSNLYADIAIDRRISDSRAVERPDTSDIAHSIDAVASAPTATVERFDADESESNQTLHFDTIRVRPRQLDSLMTHAGELSVVRTHLSHQVKKLAGTLNQVERRRRQISVSELIVDLELLRKKFVADLSRLDAVSRRLTEEVAQVRLLPLDKLFSLFPRMVRDISIALGKEANLEVIGGDAAVDRHIIEELKSPITHLLRNAIDHGLESAKGRESAGKSPAGLLQLRGQQQGDMVIIEVSDDGRGLDIEKIRSKAIAKRLVSEHEGAGLSNAQLQALIFRSGFSTHDKASDISGRGIGLDVVRDSVERLKGTVTVDSQKSRGSTFRIELPLTLATSQVVLATVDGNYYGFPVLQVEKLCHFLPHDIFRVDGAETVMLDEAPISFARLDSLLGIQRQNSVPSIDTGCDCVVIRSGLERLAVAVDSVVDQQEVVLKPTGALLDRVKNFFGSTILATGDICLILNPVELLLQVSTEGISATGISSAEERASPGGRILLVEDSLITRVQERRILESAGYQVVMAVDGREAFALFSSEKFDAIVTDVNMPNMDGFELTRRIRQNDKDVAIVIVTTKSDESDRQRGMDLGANAYIAKNAFERSILLDALQRLIG